MIQLFATTVFVAAIAALFYLDRDVKCRTAKALWIPVIWMLIVGSRELSVWLNSGKGNKLAERYTEGNPLDAAAYGILIVAGLLVLNFRTQRVKGFLRENAPILLFFVFCGVSILWSDFPLVALKRWIKGIGTFEMVLIILTDSNPLVATKRFFSRTAFLLLPLSALLILFYPKLGTDFDTAARITYYVGVTTQKNALGLTCLVCGLGSLWLFLGALGDRNAAHRVRHLIAHGVILSTALWLLKTCDSMTSLTSFVIAGAVMIVTTLPSVAKKSGNVHIVVGSAVALAIFAAFIDSNGALLHFLGRNETLTGRTEIWKAVLSLQTNPFFGAGYDSFWLGNRIQRVWEIIGYKGIAEAHNGYLEIYINLGLVGLAMLGMLLVSGYRNALAELHRNPYAGRLKVAFVTAGVIYSLTEAGFRMISPLWIVFLLEITAAPIALEYQKRQRQTGLPLIAGKVPQETRILR